MNVLELAKKLNKDYSDDKLAIIANVTPEYKKLPTGKFSSCSSQDGFSASIFAIPQESFRTC